MVALYIFRREFKLYFIYNNIPTKFALLQAHIVWEGWRGHLNDLEHTNAHYMLNILAFQVVVEILEKNQPYLRIFFFIIYFLERRVPLFYQLASPSTNVLCAKIGRIGLRKSRDEVVLTVNRRTYGRWKMCDTEGDTETSEMAIDCVVIFDLQTKGEQKNSISLSGERNLRSRINTFRFVTYIIRIESFLLGTVVIVGRLKFLNG